MYKILHKSKVLSLEDNKEVKDSYFGLCQL